MQDTSTPTLVVAHQLPPTFERRVTAALPAWITWRGLAAAAAWEVPPDATVLVAVPARGGNVVVPQNRPPGWPGKLRWVQAVSAGVDQYPPWMFDVPLVTCGRGTSSGAIAEYVLAALLSVVKSLDEIWINDAAQWQPRALGTLEGKTLGLIGYGSIGQAVAARARPFGMKILATRRDTVTAPAGGDVRFAGLDDVLAESDHLVVAVPLTKATAGLIGQEALARTKPGVHLVNVSRGAVLDHAALLAALDGGQIGFATLDVTEPEPLPAGHPLYTHPRVHLSPHISWSNGEPGQAFAEFFAENLRRFVSGETLAGLVQPKLGY